MKRSIYFSVCYVVVALAELAGLLLMGWLGYSLISWVLS